jgi:drug/metabolite transporter (DMT)-like permease
MTLLGESMTAGATVGVLAIILGTALITLDPRKLGEDNRGTRAGIPYALVSLLLFGLATYIVGWAAQRVGWVQAVGIGRVFSVVAVIPIVVWVWPNERHPARSWRAGAVAVGVLDVAGISIFSRGAEVGLVSVVSSIAATFPLIPFVGGIVMLRERPVPSQIVGAFLVVGGLVGLSAAQ